VSDHVTAILIALVIFARGAFLAWIERPHERTGRCKSCDTRAHPAPIHASGHDDQACT
jgi:hypothetical protein